MGDEEMVFVGVQDGQEGTNDDPESSRLTKFVFEKEVNMLLMETVRQSDAQISLHRKKEECFSKVRPISFWTTPY